MHPFKSLFLPMTCALALSACQTANPQGGKAVASAPTPASISAAATARAMTLPYGAPAVSSDPRVQQFPLDGPVPNTLTQDRTRSVIDNTTAGGYTVFDDSVTVYPLPGETTPDYLPAYAVPPLDKQYKPEAPMVGAPIGLASASSTLPPVPTVDVPEADPYAKPPVPGAIRKPLMLTAPEPVTMQPPSSARPPMKSPFTGSDSGAKPRAPMLTSADPAPINAGRMAPVMDDTIQVNTDQVNTGSDFVRSSKIEMPVPVASQPRVSDTAQMSAGRKSGPLLTGY